MPRSTGTGAGFPQLLACPWPRLVCHHFFNPRKRSQQSGEDFCCRLGPCDQANTISRLSRTTAWRRRWCFKYVTSHAPLVFISAVCDKGNRVVFGRSGGVITNLAAGAEVPFERRGGVYALGLWVHRPRDAGAAAGGGQAPTVSSPFVWRRTSVVLSANACARGILRLLASRHLRFLSHAVVLLLKQA